MNTPQPRHELRLNQKDAKKASELKSQGMRMADLEKRFGFSRHTINRAIRKHSHYRLLS